MCTYIDGTLLRKETYVYMHKRRGLVRLLCEAIRFGPTDVYRALLTKETHIHTAFLTIASKWGRQSPTDVEKALIKECIYIGLL